MDTGDLKKQFDKVVLKHNVEGPNKGTKAALIKGNSIFLGEARLDQRDNFNRYVGRQIALGRALYEFRVASGKLVSRGEKKHSKVIVVNDSDNIEPTLDREIFGK